MRSEGPEKGSHAKIWKKRAPGRGTTGTMALREQKWVKCYFLGLFKDAAEDKGSWSLVNEGEVGRRRGQQDSHGSGLTEAMESVWILL